MEATSADFMLTAAVLAIGGSGSPLKTGTAGEVSLCNQLSGLLQDKEMSPEELNLHYCYRFGQNIADVLGMIGFDGKLHDFVAKQKCLSLRNGCVALAKASDAEELVAMEKPPMEDYMKALSEAETASTIDDDGDNDEGSAESEVDINIDEWHALGGRLVAAFASHQEDCEQDFDAGLWKDVSGRVATAIPADESDDEERSPDVAQWHRVNERLIRKLTSLDSDDDC
jgi:hypothetical protein